MLLRSVGFEPARLTDREQDILHRSHGSVRGAELQRRGARAARNRQVASVPTDLAIRPPGLGGKATIANMFVNNTTGRRGLVAQYDVICFDEVSGVSFDTKEGVNILKGYMESGEFSRGKESIRAEVAS